MLTGDNDRAAKMISTEANVERYFANLLPEDKVTAIQKFQNEGYTVAMGGTGTDTTIETAYIVLMADNLDKLPYTIKLSKKA